MKGFKNLSDSCDPVGNPETIKEVPSQIKTEGPIKNFWACLCPLQVWSFFYIFSRTVAYQAEEPVPYPGFRVQFTPFVQVNMINPKRFQVLLFDKGVNYLPFPGNW